MFTGQMEEKINNKELFEEQQENIILRFSFLLLANILEFFFVVCEDADLHLNLFV